MGGKGNRTSGGNGGMAGGVRRGRWGARGRLVVCRVGLGVVAVAVGVVGVFSLPVVASAQDTETFTPTLSPSITPTPTSSPVATWTVVVPATVTPTVSLTLGTPAASSTFVATLTATSVPAATATMGVSNYYRGDESWSVAISHPTGNYWQQGVFEGVTEARLEGVVFYVASRVGLPTLKRMEADSGSGGQVFADTSDSLAVGWYCAMNSNTLQEGMNAGQACVEAWPGFSGTVMAGGVNIVASAGSVRGAFELGWSGDGSASVTGINPVYYGTGYQVTATPTLTVTPRPTVAPVCDWVSWWVYPVEWGPVDAGGLSSVLVMTPLGSTEAQVTFTGAVVLSDGGSTWSCDGGGWCDVPPGVSDMWCYGNGDACRVTGGRYRPDVCTIVTPMPTFTGSYAGTGIEVVDREENCIPGEVSTLVNGALEWVSGVFGWPFTPMSQFGFVLCLQPREIVSLQWGTWNMLPIVNIVIGFAGLLVVVWFIRRR